MASSVRVGRPDTSAFDAVRLAASVVTDSPSSVALTSLALLNCNLSVLVFTAPRLVLSSAVNPPVPPVPAALTFASSPVPVNRNLSVVLLIPEMFVASPVSTSSPSSVAFTSSSELNASLSVLAFIAVSSDAVLAGRASILLAWFVVSPVPPLPPVPLKLSMPVGAPGIRVPVTFQMSTCESSTCVLIPARNDGSANSLSMTSLRVVLSTGLTSCEALYSTLPL